MGGKSVNTSATRAEALTLQSSTYGATITWLRGQHRLSGNLLWYGDFKATAHTQKQGGKGGGGKSTTYTYSASVVMAMCHGVVVDVPSVWKGKSKTTLSALSLTRLSGAVGQPTWSGLLDQGVQALGYSGLAAVVAKNYELGDSASLENHSFEVRHASAFSVSADTPDVDPANAVRELLIDQLQGAGLPASIMGDWTEWSNYCIASRMLMSPKLDAQVDASELLETAADLTNTAIVWSGGKLLMRPYGDQELVAYGRTYRPDTVPVYQLDDSCYLVENGEAPIKRALKTPEDCFNQVSISYRDRQNGYNTAIATAKDVTDISANGVRPMDTIEAQWITEGAVARLVAEIKKQRSLLVLGTYTFKLPINFALVECMDLLTLTEATLLLEDVPVRVKEIVEESDFELTITCEDYPAGVASAPRYPVQTPVGFAQDAFAAPGTVTEVAVFEAPAAMAAGGAGLEVWCAVKSAGPQWGGCRLHVSLDGTTYRAVARIEGPSRMGLLVEAMSADRVLLHGVSGQLVGASAEDAQALTTLSVILGAQPEYLAYESALLLGQGAYQLGGLKRGAYNTAASVHAAGDRFVRIDESIARSGGLDASYIGRRIWLKLTSFNLYGGSEQSLAEVDAIPYDVTGVFARALPGIGGRGIALKASASTVKQADNGQRTPTAIELRAELRGTLTGSPTWTVVEGEATLSGAGLTRTIDASTISAPARVRVSLTDELATYSDELTLLVVSDGDEGAAGADGSKFTLVSLYQWAPTRPAAPSGQSKWTWATGLQQEYTGGAGWQIGIPENPGGTGLRLWSASKQISAAGGTLTTLIAWGADAAIAAVGSNGDGVQTSEAMAYAWALNLASLPALQGTADYVWATGAVTSVPDGWSTTPGTSASPGMTLFKASFRVQDAASQPKTQVRWVEASVSAVGYSGTSGAAGQAGASYRIAYAKVIGVTIGSGQVTTDGAATWPPDNSWGAGESWGPMVPSYAANQSVMVTNGVYSPSTGKTVWGSPYLATWRVGKLSAITADLGAITAGSLNIGGGKFQVDADGYLTARGALIQDESGRTLLSARAGALVALPVDMVTVPSSTLNADPMLLEGGNAWELDAGLKIQGPSTALGATGSMYISADTSGQKWAWSRSKIPWSSKRRMDYTALLYAGAGNDRNMYLVVRMWRADGREYGGIDLGWPAGLASWGGTFAGYAFGGLPATGRFSQYGAAFGFGTSRPVPDDVAYIRVGVWFQYQEGTSNVQQAAEEIRVIDSTDQAAAEAARTAADAAQVSANSALGVLAAMRSNGILDASEKPNLIKLWNEIYNERPTLEVQANVYGLTTEWANYWAQYLQLSNYLGSLSPRWDDTTADTPIVPATDQSYWSTFYYQRNQLRQAIAIAAGKVANWNGVSGSGKPLDNAGKVVDGDRDTNRLPPWYPVGVTREFKHAAAIGLSDADGVYVTLETNKQWVDDSGGPTVQYAYQGQKTWRRYGTNAAEVWGGWVQDLDRAAYTGDLNATNGATIGQDLRGVYTQQSWNVYMPNALIDKTHIKSLSAELISTGINGGSAQGIQIFQNVESVFTETNAETITIGWLGPR